MIEVDVRGFSCPVPVVQTKEVIGQHPGETISVLVETQASRESVSRLARNLNYSVVVEKTEDGFRLLLTPCSKI